MNKKRLYQILFFGLILIGFPILVNFSSYFIYVAGLFIIYAIMAMSLNFLTGFGGQISIGHAGFLAIGAYTTAIATIKLGLPFWLCLPLSGIITAIIGFLIGLPSVRLSGHFLAIATLAFGLAIPEITLKWESLTGGFAGLFINKPELFSTDTRFYYFMIVVSVIVTWLLLNLLKGNLGRAFVAIRESEISAEAMGVNVALYKTIMFSISAFFTGIAGGLYSYFVGFISPHDFNMNISLIVLAMIVIGGLASIPGSILGALILTIIPQIADRFPGYTITITGLALIFTILFLPNGLISLFSNRFTKRREVKSEIKQITLER